EIDPYHAQRAGGAVELPGRAVVLAWAWALLALGLVLLVRPRPPSAVVALLAASATAFVSCPHNSAFFHGLQVALLAAACLGVALACARMRGRVRWLARLALATLALLAVELAFSCVARSHAVGYTLASRLWFARHWNPPGNRLGFRDAEHAEDGRK